MADRYNDLLGQVRAIYERFQKNGWIYVSAVHPVMDDVADILTTTDEKKRRVSVNRLQSAVDLYAALPAKVRALAESDANARPLWDDAEAVEKYERTVGPRDEFRLMLTLRKGEAVVYVQVTKQTTRKDALRALRAFTTKVERSWDQLVARHFPGSPEGPEEMNQAASVPHTVPQLAGVVDSGAAVATAA